MLQMMVHGEELFYVRLEYVTAMFKTLTMFCTMVFIENRWFLYEVLMRGFIAPNKVYDGQLLGG